MGGILSDNMYEIFHSGLGSIATISTQIRLKLTGGISKENPDDEFSFRWLGLIFRRRPSWHVVDIIAISSLNPIKTDTKALGGFNCILVLVAHKVVRRFQGGST
jgi:hypothetical protein